MNKAEQMYQDNLGLVHMLSKRVFARTQAAKLSMQYEDVFQEVSLVLVKASEKFEPNKGLTFSAYLTRAAYNNINRIVEKETNFVIKLETISNVDEELGEIQFPSNALNPEQECQLSEHLATHMASLSVNGRRIINWMVNPPKRLLEEIKMAECKVQLCNAAGQRRQTVKFTEATVLKFFSKCHGLSYQERHLLKREIAPLMEYL